MATWNTYLYCAFILHCNYMQWIKTPVSPRFRYLIYDYLGLALVLRHRVHQASQ